VPEFKKLYEDASRDPTKGYIKDLIDTAAQIEGVVRNVGTHAAGVVITDKPIVEYAPLHRPTSNSDDVPIKTVTQFEMAIVDYLGLLKVDFLGLSTLTVMARACEMIKKRHGKEYNLSNIPTDDPAAYELMGRGDTAGVFQVEGAGMRRNLMEMKPQTLDHVIAMISLYRPGPLAFIPTYIKRMRGEEKVEYRHPSLASIFDETYGIPVYQEQIMRAAVELAGYTASEADGLRKAIAKKKKDKIKQHREKFIKGAVERGVMDKATASAIFDDWEEFARYGFNKAHAADYGVVAVQTAYLKAHYPAEYMTALLSVFKDNTDKVTHYIADSRRMGIEVLPPDVNASAWDFTIEDREEGTAIRFGLGAIKNVGHHPVEVILAARDSGGPFEDINDFLQRVDLREVGKRALESMIKVGALDAFGDRASLLESLDRIMSASASHFQAAAAGQMSLFGEHTGLEQKIHLSSPAREIDRREILEWERELLGLYVSDHPLSPYKALLERVVSHNSNELGDVPHEGRVKVAGMVTRVRPHQTRTGKTMGFATIEDMYGSMELVIFPRTWSQCFELVKDGNFIIVDGKVDADGEPKILVDKITTSDKITVAQDEAAVLDAILPDKNGSASAQPQVAEPPAHYVPNTAPPAEAPMEEGWMPDDDMPPPPDPFPPDWGFDAPQTPTVPQSEDAPSAKESLPEPLTAAPALQSEPSPPQTAPSAGEPHPESSPAPEAESTPAVMVVPPPARPVAAQPAGLPRYARPAVTPSTDGQSVRMVRVVMRSTGDALRDKLRVRRVYGVLFSYPGEDRFAFQIFEGERGYLVEFPNFTTGVCPELLERLRFIVGAENVIVEP
ncbi:MAG: DNA polymerase III subunit alpha, partial [Anaerolineae bacterium]